MARTSAKVIEIGGSVPTNDASSVFDASMPYVAHVAIVGVADILFHRWSCEGVEAKSKAAKGSTAKKTDDIESYMYRDDDGVICIPGEYLRMAVINAAKFRQDPRSPRKSAMDLFKAGITVLTVHAPTGAKEPDYIHQCRVMIQRSGVTRSRPALKVGWRAEFDLQINLPEYIQPSDLNEVVQNAGRLMGLGDFRPTYGRFQVTGYSVS